MVLLRGGGEVCVKAEHNDRERILVPILRTFWFSVM
jgi:hypothetical protein